MKKYSTLKITGLTSLWLVCSLAIHPAQAEDGIDIIGSYDPAAMKIPVVSGPEIWKDPSQPGAARVHDLVSRLSLAEKAALLRADAIAIPRLSIPAYSYRNECLHGVKGNNNKTRSDAKGVATVFPEPIGMGATWDVPLMHEEADVIATEARAKFNDHESKHPGDNAWHMELSFYSPNINLFRDPRWGRGQETYGEDPFLISQFGVAYIRGLQGDDPKYVKAMACAKHYAVHSGPEPVRTYISMSPPERDLYETYLPAFEAAVREGHVGSVMGAYSSLYGVPDCENPFLLTQMLRERWGFEGFVVSDGGAILENWRHHHYEATPEEAAANAVKAGCDLFSGPINGRKEGMLEPTSAPSDFEALGLMLQKNLLSEKEIDTAISYTLAARFRLGLFDPPSMVPWSKIGIDQNDTPEHRALALKVAEESIVLLKNNGALPFNRAKLKRIAVIGPNADAAKMLLGNYNGQPSHSTTILDGIKDIAGPNIEVTYAAGCPIALKNDNSNKPAPDMAAQALAAAKSADVIVFVSGIDSSMEHEGWRATFRGFLGGDRTRIELPPPQEELIKALHATGKPIILVNCSGSAMAMPWEAKHLPAIVQAWYPGEEGGKAVAEVLFGEVNPAGRLPITFYRSTADLPSFTDYSMSNRTYRYFNGKPLFAFGHGLSYTKFSYKNVSLESSIIAPDGMAKISFRLKNTGKRDGDEVAQVYFRHIHSAVPQPKLALCGFERIRLAKGKSTTVTLEIPAERFRYWDTEQKRYVVEPGKYQLLVGGASDDIRLRVPFMVGR
jgi:beta-glucosidase